MGQKIYWIILFVLSLCWAEVQELGRVVDLRGNITVSRNTDLFSPKQATRLYFNDYVTLADNAALVVKTNYNDQLIASGNSRFQILGPKELAVDYGFVYFEALPEEKEKSISRSLVYTACFPGYGHWYIEDKPKAIVMTIFSTHLIYNILTINPESSVSYHEMLYNQREQYKQIYFVYWLWALLDVYEGTNRYNRILVEEESLKVSLWQSQF